MKNEKEWIAGFRDSTTVPVIIEFRWSMTACIRAAKQYAKKHSLRFIDLYPKEDYGATFIDGKRVSQKQNNNIQYV